MYLIAIYIIALLTVVDKRMYEYKDGGTEVDIRNIFVDLNVLMRFQCYKHYRESAINALR